MMTQTAADLRVEARPRFEGLRRLGVASAAGAVAGFLIGGVGGRLAMLVLRLTSDPRLHGLPTDDGFTIGVVSSDTVSLLVLTAVLGAVGGVAYLAVRAWLPRRARAWVVALLGGAIGGAAIVRPDGIDFTALDPLPLAVVLFVAIPAAGMALTSVLAERWLVGGATSMWWLLGIVPLLPAFPVSFVAIVFASVGERAPELGAVWSSRAATIAGRTVLAVLGGLGAIALVRDVAAIL